MKINISITIISSAMFLGACSSAPKSNEVSASYVPMAQYNNFTCDQLVTEAESLRRSIPAMESTVDKHRSNQTGVEVITWVLFWPAAFALDKGTEYSQPLAKAKGELQAIQTALMTKKCSEQIIVKENPNNPANPQNTERTNPVPSAVTESGAVSPSKPISAGSSTAERIKQLETLKNEGLITEDEYSNKRRILIETL